MKRTIRIAKLELSTLFYSPIAWFLLIVFFFQCGYIYTDKLGNFLIMQGTGAPKEVLYYLTLKVYGGPYGMFTDIIGKLYLYIPLLTMGLMSREFSSGTIKLLYSSPIGVGGIVGGKFLSMMVYSFLLTLVLAVFVVISCFNIAHADYGQMLAALLGIYLLLCAYSAIGLFMSCLTSYQVVAALSTFVVFAILNYIGAIGQQIDLVRNLTSALSIAGRSRHMIDGLISSRDVLYFLTIIYLFLGLSILKLKAGRESKPKPVIAGRYALLLTSGILVSYLSSRPGLVAYYDATAAKTQTLTPATQQILHEIGDAPLEVDSYINILDQRYWYGAPDKRSEDMERWESYLRFKPDIRFSYTYYYDSVPDPEMFRHTHGQTLKDIAGAYASLHKVSFDLFKSPAEIRKIIDLAPEQNRYVMQLRYNGKKTFLRLFNDNDAFPYESETSAALKRMITTLPKIAFLQGEQERSIDQFGTRSFKPLASDITFRYALINQGFDMETVSLRDHELPADISVLVIADPLTSFEPIVLDRIRRYIAGGGSLFIAGEPGNHSALDPIIQPLGVQFTDGTLTQPSRDHSPDLVLCPITAAGAALSQLVRNDFQDNIPVALSGAAALSYSTDSGYHIEPYLITGPPRTASLTTGHNPPATQATVLALSRTINGRQQRIVIAGDADFISILSMRREHIETANYHFNVALFGWLSGGRFPIDTTRPKPKDDHLDVTMSAVTALKFICMGIVPALLLLLSSILLIRRKKQ